MTLNSGKGNFSLKSRFTQGQFDKMYGGSKNKNNIQKAPETKIRNKVNIPEAKSKGNSNTGADKGKNNNNGKVTNNNINTAKGSNSNNGQTGSSNAGSNSQTNGGSGSTDNNANSQNLNSRTTEEAGGGSQAKSDFGASFYQMARKEPDPIPQILKYKDLLGGEFTNFVNNYVESMKNIAKNLQNYGQDEQKLFTQKSEIKPDGSVVDGASPSASQASSAETSTSGKESLGKGDPIFGEI